MIMISAATSQVTTSTSESSRLHYFQHNALCAERAPPRYDRKTEARQAREQARQHEPEPKAPAASSQNPLARALGATSVREFLLGETNPAATDPEEEAAT